MEPFRLTGRSSSHFTRVVRMFALELGLPLELRVLRDMKSLDVADYGGHPAFKIPTLEVDGQPLFGTEQICRTLVERAGRSGDARVVLAEHVRDVLGRSAQELVWHAMSAQVQLVVGVTIGGLPADNVYFVKARQGLEGALGWLDQRLDAALAVLPAERQVSTFEVTLLCLLEHVVFRPTVEVSRWARLARFAEAYGARPSAQATRFHFDAA